MDPNPYLNALLPILNRAFESQVDSNERGRQKNGGCHRK